MLACVCAREPINAGHLGRRARASLPSTLTEMCLCFAQSMCDCVCGWCCSLEASTCEALDVGSREKRERERERAGGSDGQMEVPACLPPPSSAESSERAGKTGERD